MIRKTLMAACSLLLVAGGLFMRPMSAVAAINVVSRTLISATPSSTAGNGSAARPVMTPDGRYVTFISSSTDLLPGVPGSGDQSQAYLYDRQQHTMELVSVGTDGNPSTVGSYPQAISDDGRYVLFTSGGSNMPTYPNDPSKKPSIFLRDRQTGTTTAVGDPTHVSTGISDHAMSSDGNIIAYSGKDYSDPNNPVSGQFILNRSTGTITTLSSNNYQLSVSANGQYASYVDLATHQLANGATTHNAYRYNLSDATTQQITDNAQTILLSPDGSHYLASTSDAATTATSDVVYGDVQNTQQQVLFTGNEGGGTEGLSFDRQGRRVAFFIFTETPTRGGKAVVADLTSGDQIVADTGLFIRPTLGINGDGTQLVFSSVNGDVNNQIYVAQLTPPAPNAPTSLAAPSPAKTAVLTWNASNGATGYNVYRDGAKIASPSATTYTDTAAADGTHAYYVTATNAGGESSASNTVNVVVDTTRPTVSVTPAAGSMLNGTVSFTITLSDNNALDVSKNKSVWVYLYDTAGTQKHWGAKVDLSSGQGTFTVNTALLDNGNANLDVGIVYDAAGNASGTTDNYFRNFTITN